MSSPSSRHPAIPRAASGPSPPIARIAVPAPSGCISARTSAALPSISRRRPDFASSSTWSKRQTSSSRTSRRESAMIWASPSTPCVASNAASYSSRLRPSARPAPEPAGELQTSPPLPLAAKCPSRAIPTASRLSPAATRRNTRRAFRRSPPLPSPPSTPTP